jgi:hypothetical protein
MNRSSDVAQLKSVRDAVLEMAEPCLSRHAIHDSLKQVFLSHRRFFWYDAVGEWTETF